MAWQGRRHSDAAVRAAATRDRWMLDFWADQSRHAVTVQERPGMPRGRREYRQVCTCGLVGEVRLIIEPPGTCPVLVALQARERGIMTDKDRRQRERYERPPRTWKALQP